MSRTNSQLSVAMLGTLPPLRGISAYCTELVKALAQLSGVHIEFISCRSMYPKMLYPGGDDQDATMDLVDLDGLSHRRRIRWYNPLTWLFEGLRVRADVLHVQWWSWFLAPIYVTIVVLFKLRGIPVIATIHNVLPHERAWYKRWLNASIFRFPDHFIVHSDANVTQLAEQYGIARDRISKIPHGIVPFGEPAPGGRDRIRKKFSFNDDDQVILAFGTIRPYKGLDVLLEAFATVARQRPSTRLLIAGKNWEAWEPYSDQIRSLGIAEHVGLQIDYVPARDVPDYFLAADLVVLPYRHFTSQTGVGTIALPFGKPLIVTDVGGLSELVKDADCVVPPNDPTALAAAITKVLEEPGRLEALSEDSKQLVKDFEWDSIADKVTKVYQQHVKPQHTVRAFNTPRHNASGNVEAPGS